MKKVLYKNLMKLNKIKRIPEPHRKVKRDWTLNNSRCFNKKMAFKNELLQYSRF